ncbi:MAG: ABC transporter substrate-binding protein, partial [Proteobacteria bacterium]|nr:ABC transporter substrate-binding protein [Pseudomonadota bacterium]
MKFVNRQILIFSSILLNFVVLPACTKKKSELKSNSAGLKIFYHLRLSEEKSLDPVKQFDAASHQQIRSLYDTLLQYKYLKRPYELEPSLLTKMPERQADPGSYLFSLKQGVLFHDNPCFPGGKGRELNADDIIYNFKRFANANENQLSYTIIQGLIVGLDEFREVSKKQGKEFNPEKLEIDGIKKIDKYNFTIKFTKDSPLNFYPLAFGGLSIVPKEAVDKYGADFDKNPVGTGPFYMKNYSRRGTTVLARNPNYHEVYPTEGAAGDKEAGLLEAAGKKLPFVDEVQLPLIEEAQPQMLKFKKGQIAWVAVNRDDFKSMVDQGANKQFSLKPEFAKQFQLYYSPSLSTSFMRFGMKDPILGTNKALRQAIALAMNSEGFVDLMYNGRGYVSDSIVPLEIAGSTRDSGSVWYKQNLELAKKKLIEAGYPEGKGLAPITIEYRASTKDQRQQHEYMRNELAKIGIKLEGNFQTFSSFLKKTDAGNYQMAD